TVTGPGGATSASLSYVVTAPAPLPVQGSAGTFTDDFGRADSPDLGSGWTLISGALQVSGGAARNAATRALHLEVPPSLSGPAQTVGMRFASADNNGSPVFGLALRYQSPGNYYRCYRTVGGTSVVRISRIVNGVETVLKSVAVPNPARGVFFTLSCQ